VEALLEGEEAGADVDALGAKQPGVGAGEFHRALPGFGAGVREEDAVEAGALRQPLGERGLPLVEVEVGGVDEGAALADDGFDDDRVGVAERVDANAAEQVEVAAALLVDEVHALAPLEEEGIAVVGGKQKSRLSLANSIEFHFGVLSEISRRP